MEVWIIVLLLIILAVVYVLHCKHMAWLKHITDAVEILVRKNRAP